MTDKWALFKLWWRTDDTESPITDASEANDYMVETSINEFQRLSKEVTDITVALSASRADIEERLRKLNEAVTLAYTYALDGNLSSVKETLEKVVDV